MNHPRRGDGHRLLQFVLSLGLLVPPPAKTAPPPWSACVASPPPAAGPTSHSTSCHRPKHMEFTEPAAAIASPAASAAILTVHPPFLLYHTETQASPKPTPARISSSQPRWMRGLRSKSGSRVSRLISHLGSRIPGHRGFVQPEAPVVVRKTVPVRPAPAARPRARSRRTWSRWVSK